jgi:hypothetical protein
MLTGCRSIAIVFSVVVLCAVSCSRAETAESAEHHNFTLVGSTPCDAAIKAALAIAAETKCDFIRWSIAMDPTKGNAFKLDANYGEAQPNTLGFVVGGQRIAASGSFEVANLKELPPRPRSADTPPKQGGEPEHKELPPRPRSADTPPKQGGEPEHEELPPRPQSANTPPKQGGEPEVYRLKSDKPAIDVTLVKVNPNLFHLLMPDGTMMIGNGGWSYTLNRSVPIATAPMPAVSFAAAAEQAPAPQTIFVGRTPCKEIMELTGMVYDAQCFKLKWKLTLNRDAATRQPTTFMIESTASREKPITGKWSIVKSGEATIYSLTPDASMKPFSLMLAEDNLLFFLNTAGRPLVGNKDFSFTLNRRQ